MSYDKKIWVSREEADILKRHYEFENIESDATTNANGFYSNYLGSRDSTHYMIITEGLIEGGWLQTCLERRLLPHIEDPLRQELYDYRRGDRY
jgi:hypothetical protein